MFIGIVVVVVVEFHVLHRKRTPNSRQKATELNTWAYGKASMPVKGYQSITIDQTTYNKVAEIRDHYGLKNMSETMRLIIKKHGEELTT
ncbi:MAG: hypothetical protein LC650_02495 [Actinobacteria bacterium]|nr:hypothetical protein [Actinomycetota bacterium]